MDDLRPVAAILAVALLGVWLRLERRQQGVRPSDDRPGWRYQSSETGPARLSAGPSWGARAGAAWGRWRAGR